MPPRTLRLGGWLFLLASLVALLPTNTWGKRQVNDSWIEYASYTHSQGLTHGAGRILAYTPCAITDYQPQSGELNRMSRLYGLSNSGIVAVFPLADGKRTIVAYRDGTLDLLADGQETRTNRQLKQRISSGELTPITHFCQVGEQLIGASSRWLYSLSTKDLNLEDGSPIWSAGGGSLGIHDIARMGEKLLVATSSGLYTSGQAGLIKGLEPLQSGDYRLLVNLGQDAIAVRQEGAAGAERSFIELVRPGDIQALTSLNEPVLSLQVYEGNICITTPNQILQIASDGAPTTLYSTSTKHSETGDITSAIASSQGTLYLATTQMGLVRAEGANLRQLSPPSPTFDGAYSIIASPMGATFSRGWLANTGKPTGEPFTIYRSDDTNPTDNKGVNLSDPKAHDALIIRRLPGDADEYLVGTGNGQLKHYRGDEYIATFDADNSPLVKRNASTEVIVSDIAIGPEGDWWVYALNAEHELLHRQPNGQWEAYDSPIDPHEYDPSQPRKRTYLSLWENESLWLTSEGAYTIVALRLDQLKDYVDSKGKKGVFRQPIFNENDHKHTVGRKVLFTQNGYLWMISGQGLVWAANPNALLDGGRMKLNITIGTNPSFTWDEIQLLNELDLTDMVFDSGENLWVGSYAAGLFHIDLKTNDLLHYFTMRNSPLPSNHITALDYNPKDGRLYIATAAGALSVITDSQRASEDFDDLRVYPNPVRPDFDGLVTVDGLIEEAVVKITTTSGDLVRELHSNGGRLHWDLRNGHGQEVVSGVYLLFCSDTKGKETRVIKLAIIR